ncbi:MAG: SUMF1/EgtB/PvdO family nonheme iron enzyme [Pirellulales bacterium]
MQNEGLSLTLRTPCRWRREWLLGGLRLGVLLFVATTIEFRAAGQAPGPNGSPESSARNVTIAIEPVESEAPQGNAGLFVGVNEFSDDPGLNPLQFAVHDAIELAHLFVFELRRIPAKNCVLLLAGKPTSPVVEGHLKALINAGAQLDKATRGSIFEHVTSACKQNAGKANLLVVVMSSHGFSDEGIAYVMPSDGRLASLKRTAVSLADVEADIDRDSKAGNRLLFIDACQQRSGAKAIGAPAVGMDKAFKSAFDKATGQYKLASCSPGQLSYESGKLGEGHGVFSHALLKALRGGAPSNEKNLILLRSVEEYVSKYIHEWTTQSKLPEQTPFHAGSLASLELELAKRPDDLKTLIKKVDDRQPAKQFTDDLKKRLVDLLKQLPAPPGDRDEDLLQKTRRFISGQMEEDLFVPYLEKQLASRVTPPPPPPARPQTVTLTALGASQQPVVGAWVELLWRANAEDKPQVVGEGATDAKGRCEIRSPKHGAGIFSAIAWRGDERSEEVRLEMFPSQREWTLPLSIAPRDKKPGQLYVNSMGMRFAYIPPGRFLMGKTHEEASQFADYKPHEVRLTRGFFLGVYEVTQQEYQRIMNKNPSYFSAQGNGAKLVRDMDTSRFPVENVSWLDAQNACRTLSELPLEKESRRQYRLPTEAEWEYACRAGTTTPFFWGQSLNGDRANCDGKNYPFGTVIKGTYLARTATVGSYQANAWGLFDMHGNVWELCADWRDPDYYANSPLNDPPGPNNGTSKIRRGGSWRVPAVYCQSAHRNWNHPSETRSDPESPPDTGFRVLLEVPSPAP